MVEDTTIPAGTSTEPVPPVTPPTETPFDAQKFIKTIQSQIESEERAKAEEELKKNSNVTKELYKHFQEEQKKTSEQYSKEKEILQKQIETMQKQIEELGKPKGSQSPEPTGQPPLSQPANTNATGAERAKLVLRKMGVNC